jgi:hypothetical protein
MDKSRQVKNCESAKTSRDGQRQRLGDIEFKRRNAEAERARRKKKKEETELAQFAAEVELEEGENQQTQVPQAYQPAHQQARQQEQLAASVAAELQKLQKLQQEVVEAQAKLDAIKAAAAAAAAPPPPPPQPAPPPPPAAPTAQSPPAWKPLPADLHEAHLLALSFSPLPPGSTSEQYSQRVSDALENDIPFLSRPATVEWISEWVVNQAPREHAIEVRGMYNRLSTDEKKDSHAVAARVVDIIAAAVDPLLALREGLRKGGVNEFIGLADDGPGRRPHGMGSGGKGSGKGGKGAGNAHGAGAGSSGGKGSGKGGKGSSSSSQRYTCCSVPPPIGPMCDRAHPPPCWRDPRERPEIPKRLCDNAVFMSGLAKDRLENANRIGVASLEVQCSETIGVG